MTVDGQMATETETGACGCRKYLHKGSCTHTGADPWIRPTPPEAFDASRPKRDREWERQFLRYVTELAVHFGVEGGNYSELAMARADLGGQRYGDDSFLTDDRDQIAEMRDELHDAPVYAMFAIEKLRLVDRDLDESDEAYHHLAQAAAHAAVADYHASVAQRLTR